VQAPSSSQDDSHDAGCREKYIREQLDKRLGRGDPEAEAVPRNPKPVDLYAIPAALRVCPSSLLTSSKEDTFGGFWVGLGGLGFTG